MNEKVRQRPKDQNRDQTTAFQLNSRQSRNYISGRMVSLIRSNDSDNEFSAHELIQIESLLRDEFQSNQWLLNVCKSVTDESVWVTKEEVELFEKCKSDGQEMFVTQPELDQLNEELEFLRERMKVLRSIIKQLSKKLSEIQTNNTNTKINSMTNNSIDIWLHLKTKLKESLEIIKNDMSSDLTVKDPKDIVDNIVNQFNNRIDKIDGIQSPTQWLDQLLDQLVLSEDKQIVKTFNQQFCQKLEDIHKILLKLYKECLLIKEFYEIDVKEETKWRTDLMTLINHLLCLSIKSEPIDLSQTKLKSSSLSAKKLLLEEYSQFITNVENQEFDEMQALIEKLNERIEILSDENK